MDGATLAIFLRVMARASSITHAVAEQPVTAIPLWAGHSEVVVIHPNARSLKGTTVWFRPSAAWQEGMYLVATGDEVDTTDREASLGPLTMRCLIGRP